MGFKLAELFVQITAKGLETFGAQLGGVKSQLESLKTASETVGSVAGKAFAAASAALGGWVAFGLRGTVQANALAFQFERLGMAIADIFAPAITKIVDVVASIADWFRGLSDSTKDLIERFAIFTVAALGVATVLPKVIGLVMGVIQAVKMLNITVAAGPWGPLIIAISLAAGALAALFLSTENANDSLLGMLFAFKPIIDIFKVIGGVVGDVFKPLLDVIGEIGSLVGDLFKDLMGLVGDLTMAFGDLLKSILQPIADFIKMIAEQIKALIGQLRTMLGLRQRDKEGSKRDRLAKAGGGFESVQATFERLQTGSLKADMGGKGKGVPEQQLEVAQQQLAEQQETNQKLGGLKPTVGR